MSFFGSVWDELYDGHPPWMESGEGPPLTDEELKKYMEENLPTDEEVSAMMAEVFGEKEKSHP